MSSLPRTYFSQDDIYTMQPIRLHSITKEESQHLLTKPIQNNIFIEISPENHRIWFSVDEAAQYRVTCGSGLSFPHIRQFKVYHIFQLFTHCFVLFNALITGIWGIFDTTYSLSSRLFYFSFVLLIIAIDLFLAYQNYYLVKYSPYSLSSALLYFNKRIILIPQSPSTIFLLDKIGLLCQGYLFVIIPYLNILKIIYIPDSSSQLQQVDTLSSYFTEQWALHIQLVFLYVIIIQLILTLYAWITFSLFYTVFVYEIVLRTFCCFLCCFRPRKYTQTDSYPILQEHPIEFLNRKQDEENNLTSISLQNNTTTINSSPSHSLKSNIIRSLPGVYHSYYNYYQQQLYYDSLNSSLLPLLPKFLRLQHDCYPCTHPPTFSTISQPNVSHNNHNGINTSNIKTTNSPPLLSTTSSMHSNQSISPHLNNNLRLYDTFSDTSILSDQYNVLVPEFAIDQQEFIPTVPYRDHIFVSHVSDPIFYVPYQFLWQYM